MRHLTSTIVALLALCVVLVVSACGDSGGTTPAPTSAPAAAGDASAGTPASAQAVVEQTVQAFQALQDYTGAVTISFSEPQAGELSMDVALKGSLAIGLLGGEPPMFRGDVTASNLSTLPEGTIAIFGPTSYLYNPTQQIVYSAQRDRSGSGSQLYRLPLMFLSSMNQALQILTSPAVNQTVAGEEQIGSFNTVKIENSPAEGGGPMSPLAAGEQYTVWIDTATNMPVQVLYMRPDGEQRLMVTSMSVNAGVDDSVFMLETPAGATEQELAPPETVDSRETASSQAGFTAPVPRYLPEGLSTMPTNVAVQQTPLGGRILQSHTTQAAENAPDGSPATIGIHIDALNAAGGLLEQLPSALPPGASSSEVQINGQDAVMVSIGEGQATLSWRQGDTLYTIRGSGYGEDEVRQVAEGLTIE